MSFDVLLVVWCVAWCVVAGLGLRRPRMVRVAARVVRVEPPSTGAPRSAGVPVVLAFTDPAGGQELTVPATGGGNGRLDAAWVGREIEVSFPPGQPYRFRMLSRPGQGRWRGLVGPALALLVVVASLLIRFSFEAGFGLGLCGLGLLWTGAAAASLRFAVREYGRRRALLASSATVPGEVVAIVEDERRDDDGHTHVTYTPVVTFSPRGGPAVTGVAGLGSSSGHHHRDSVGRRVAVVHSTTDPSVFHLEDASERAAMTCGLLFLLFFLLGGMAVTVTGAVALTVG